MARRSNEVNRQMPRSELEVGGTCFKGLHVLTEDGIYTNPAGVRRCRECSRVSDRERSVRDREKRIASARRRYRNTDEAVRRGRNLVRFGLTVEAYDALLATQGGACAICSTTDPGGRWGTNFAVDHDHATGVVRGLLCGHCNVMLGNAKDDPARLRAAAAYLEDRPQWRA